MLVSNGRAAFVLGIALTVLCASVYAQQKVYKWVDEDGVVHFSEELPAVPPDVKVEVITTDPAPPPVPRAKTTVKSPPPVESQVKSQSLQPAREMPPLSKQVDITKMSLDELDRRCEEAREGMIAPRRAAEIEKCIQTGTGDQAWCETFWADYGAPSRTTSGDLIPGMFYDLPECTEAWEERNRRGLYPE
jgi:type IV secretory pathway VirB10-like protein